MKSAVETLNQEPALPDDLMKRIIALQSDFDDAGAGTLEEWVDGFRGDDDPSLEVAICERLAAVYKRHCGLTPADRAAAFSKEQLHNVYALLYYMVVATPVQVLERADTNLITFNEVKALLRAYHAVCKEANTSTIHPTLVKAVMPTILRTNRFGGTVMASCLDCDKPFYARHEYIVREVWREAGMLAWDAGYLHRRCLESRLGRKLIGNDLLATMSETKNRIKMYIHPDYYYSPEHLDTISLDEGVAA